MAESIASSFMRRRVQPCQEQTNAGYEYLGINDPTSFKKELLMGVKLMDRLKRLFHGVESLPPAVIGFSLQKPIDKVSVPSELFFCFFSPVHAHLVLILLKFWQIMRVLYVSHPTLPEQLTEEQLSSLSSPKLESRDREKNKEKAPTPPAEPEFEEDFDSDDAEYQFRARHLGDNGQGVLGS